MPVTSNVNQVGQRLDIADIIAVADMKNTPFTTMVAKEKQATAALFSNQADAYDSPRSAPVVDGHDVTQFEDAAKNRGLISGRIQIFERTAMVTRTKEEIAKRGGIAGLKSELARAKAKKAIEFKRDEEFTYLGDQDSAADNGQAGGQTRGVGVWLSSTAQADQPVPTQFLTPAAQTYTDVLANFNETALRTLLQKRYESVGMPQGNLQAIVGTNIKSAVSDFGRFQENKASNTVVRLFSKPEPTTIATVVDIYESDYGIIEFHLDNFMPNQNRGYVLDMDYWDRYYLMNPAWRDLEDKGGGPRALLQGIMGLLCENPLGHCMIKAA